MAKSVFLCVCLFVGCVSGQYGFQNDRSERRYASFFGIPQSLINIIPETVRRIPGRISSIVHRPTNQDSGNQYGLVNGNYPNPYNQNNQNWNQNGNPYNNQYYQNGNAKPTWNQNDYVETPKSSGNGVEPNWNLNHQSSQNQNDQPQYSTEGPKQPQSYEQPQVYSTEAPKPQGYSTEAPIPENVPNDYVDLEDKGTTKAPVIGTGKNNGVNVDFEDRHGESSTLAPLEPLKPVEVRDTVSFAAFQDSCTTVDGGTGSCSVIFNCPQYASLISQARRSPDAVQLLRKVHCGFDGTKPKVCCPSSTIPTGTPPTTTTTTPSPSEGREIDDVMLQPPACGVSNATSSRVVGGQPARLADFPWMALLGYKPRRGEDPRWLCGGSLISRRHVLTAAHCIQGHEDDLYLVRLGELDLARDDEGATPTDVPIQMKIKHEAYDAKSFTNDIGLLLLERPVEFTFLIRPICIPQDRELRARSFENYTPTIAGWGDTEFRGPAATHLQALQLPVVSNQFCAEAYKQYKAQVIDDRVLCAGYKRGGHDACQGDSGGPLMQPIWMQTEHVTYFYQIGVVSYGKKCAEAGFPGVYTRVTKFVPWIEKHMTETQSL